ncbi:unnamed protein product [Heterobilharzia americana]|nr:unnamed protein product [Heterobilharzia americana]
MLPAGDWKKGVGLHSLSVDYSDSSLYATVRRGKILRIDDSSISVHAAICPSQCNGIQQCGRSLGLRFLSNSQSLLVTDAYLGVYSVPMTEGIPSKLFPTNDSFTFKFFDDSYLLPNSSAFITEASTKNSLHDLWSVLLEGEASGSVMKSEAVSGLRFPNGVELHNDGKSILVTETVKCRILRVPLDGGKVTVFSDGLPGYPDNIKASPRGGYWVPVSTFSDSVMSRYIFSRIPKWPIVRYLLSKIIPLLPASAVSGAGPTMLLRFDDEGNITEIWKDYQNELPGTTDIHEYNNTLYTGNFQLPYIGKLEMLPSQLTTESLKNLDGSKK